MGLANYLLLLISHPNEFRVLVQYKLYHDPKRDITAPSEHATSGWDRDTMRRCWHFLDLTSRSFAAVIKELEGDLARTVCLFYLVLRALDTIEDDMTLPDAEKQSLLREFSKNTSKSGWTFTGSGPNEKDRQLLVEYDKVVAELDLLNPEYKQIILDITQKMAVGMADYAHHFSSSSPSVYLNTTEEYNLYCHYVAGLVGEGLSRLFTASKLEAPWLANQLELSNSMGLLLQKTNIIRDFREDVDQRRFFWPKDVWGGYFSEVSDIPRLFTENEEVKKKALWVQSAMILDAMTHLTDALTYLRVLKKQSIFNFCAIPATMAIATLDLCFMNPDMFERNIRIRKAEAASLIMRSTNPREVSLIFRYHVRRIHSRLTPENPSFLKISVACGMVEQWCEHNYPSFVLLSSGSGGGGGGGGGGSSLNPSDPRTKIYMSQQEKEKELVTERRVQKIRETIARKEKGLLTDGEGEKRIGTGAAPEPVPAQGSIWEPMLLLGAAFVIILLVCLLVVGVVLYLGNAL